MFTTRTAISSKSNATNSPVSFCGAEPLVNTRTEDGERATDLPPGRVPGIGHRPRPSRHRRGRDLTPDHPPQRYRLRGAVLPFGRSGSTAELQLPTAPIFLASSPRRKVSQACGDESRRRVKTRRQPPVPALEPFSRRAEGAAKPSNPNRTASAPIRLQNVYCQPIVGTPARPSSCGGIHVLLH